MKPIRILIAVNQPIIREGLATILSNQEDMKVVGKAQNGLEAVQLVDDCQPDVVLLDMQMPVISGLDSLVAIKESHPHTPIIMLTTFLDPVYICEALRKGASGYILEDIETRAISDVDSTVCERSNSFSCIHSICFYDTKRFGSYVYTS